MPMGAKDVGRMREVVIIIILAALLSSPLQILSQQDEVQRIVIENVFIEGDVATLSFHLSNPYSPELMEVIKSGILVKFEYEFVIKRVHKNWFNISVGTWKILKMIQYDPLSDEYIVRQGTSPGKRFFKDLKAATEDFFRFRQLQVRLAKGAVKGKKYEISVRAQLEELDVVGIFKYIPFVSNWFEVRTDWARVRVNAR